MDEQPETEPSSLRLAKQQHDILFSTVLSGLTGALVVLEDPVLGQAVRVSLDEPQMKDYYRREIAFICKRILKAAGIDETVLQKFLREPIGEPLTKADLTELFLLTRKKRKT
jgi:hypothetical protein